MAAATEPAVAMADLAAVMVAAPEAVTEAEPEAPAQELAARHNTTASPRTTTVTARYDGADDRWIGRPSSFD